ncbi:MAG: hypothetical protein RL748_4376 [Pseudomonadota bacterium]|jgi:hypothetical protein
MTENSISQRLVLRKSTLRVLNEQELRWVAGGEALPTGDASVITPISLSYATAQTTTANTTRSVNETEVTVFEPDPGENTYRGEDRIGLFP